MPTVISGVVEPTLDHLVYGTPDLEATVAWFTAATGVAPVPGGRHVGRGTRNHVLGLGATAYLEIIGPDREHPADPGLPVPFGVDRLTGPRLVTWSVHPADAEYAVIVSRASGADHGELLPMSRRTSDGDLLEWRLAAAVPAPMDGVVPFLIDWGSTTHPAASGLPAIGLAAFSATHPDPAAVSRVTDALGIQLAVTAGPAGLCALLVTPHGTVILT